MGRHTLYVTRPAGERMLLPADARSEELIDKVKPDRITMIRSHTPRNGKQHRLLWAVCNLVCENLELFQTPDQVMVQLKMWAGHFDSARILIPGLGEVEHQVPRSIAYESMKQDEFVAFLEHSVLMICRELMPGMTPGAIRNEIALALGVDDWPEKVPA